MNKRGQTLVLFVILIPLIIMLMAVVIDVGVVMNKKVHLKEVTKMVISEVIEKEEKLNEAKKLFFKNDVDTEKLEIIESNNKMQVKNEIEVDSIFGSIIGIKTYDIKIDIIGYMKNDKVVFE